MAMTHSAEVGWESWHQTVDVDFNLSVCGSPPYIIDTGKSVSSVDANSLSWELPLIWHASSLFFLWNHRADMCLYGASL